MHLFFGAIITSFSLTITRDKDVFFSCPAKIEVFSVVFSVSMLIPARAIDRFFTVLSAFAKSFFWRNICYSNS